MKLVGEAFKENSLSVEADKITDVLGIATWGSIQNNSCLEIDVINFVILIFFRLI